MSWPLPGGGILEANNVTPSRTPPEEPKPVAGLKASPGFEGLLTELLTDLVVVCGEAVNKAIENVWRHISEALGLNGNTIFQSERIGIGRMRWLLQIAPPGPVGLSRIGEVNDPG